MTEELVTLDTTKESAWLGKTLRAAAPLALAGGGALAGHEIGESLGTPGAPDTSGYDALTNQHTQALQDASSAYDATVPAYDQAEYAVNDLHESLQNAQAHHHAMKSAPWGVEDHVDWTKDNAINDIMHIQGVLPQADMQMDQASEALRGANATRSQAQQTLDTHLATPPTPAPQPAMAGAGPAAATAAGAGLGYGAGRAMTKRANHDEFVTKEAGELTELFQKTEGGMDRKEESSCDKKAAHEMQADVGESYLEKSETHRSVY